MDVPYFIKEHLWMSASDEPTLKKKFGKSEPSPKLTLKTKSYHSCGSCDDSWSLDNWKSVLQMNIFKKKLNLVIGNVCYRYNT